MMTGCTRGYVYFVKPEGRPWVKIGWATDVEKRMVSLQCGSPEVLHCLFAFAADLKTEGATRMLASSGFGRGEWTAWAPTVEQFIETLRGKGEDAESYVLRLAEEEPRRVRERVLRNSITAQLSLDLADWLISNPDLLWASMSLISDRLIGAAASPQRTDAVDMVIAELTPWSSAGAAA